MSVAFSFALLGTNCCWLEVGYFGPLISKSIKPSSGFVRPSSFSSWCGFGLNCKTIMPALSKGTSTSMGEAGQHSGPWPYHFSSLMWLRRVLSESEGGLGLLRGVGVVLGGGGAVRSDDAQCLSVFTPPWASDLLGALATVQTCKLAHTAHNSTYQLCLEHCTYPNLSSKPPPTLYKV